MPKDGSITVNVWVFAPDEEKTSFEGEIKIVNKDNPDDFDTIKVTLQTPYCKNTFYSLFLQFLKKICQQFPLLEYILLNLNIKVA